MSGEPKNTFRDSVYASMNQKDTEELLDIWKRNDREEWAGIAFEVIHDILMEREGSVPDQGIDEKAQEGKIMDQKPDTYHDPDVLIRIAEWARSAAWIALIICLLIWGTQVTSYISSVTSPSPYADVGLAQIATGILGTGGTLISGAWYFIVLRFVSEVIYVLMDIEDNTRSRKESD